MKRPRILIIENSIAMTGALESIMRSSVQLSDQFDFIFLLPQNSKAIELVKTKKFLVYELRMRELRKSLSSFLIYFPSLLLSIFKLRKLIYREKIDFLVCNDFYNLLPVANKIMGGRTDYVCYVRFLPSKFPFILVRLWFGLHNRYARKIIAVSGAVKRELPVSEKVTIIYNELPDEDVDYTPPLSKIILYPANYISGKGQNYALKAFAKISAQFPQWRLRFVGGDMGLEKNKQYKKRLEELSKKYGIQDQVQWNDFSSNLKEDYLNAAIVLNFSESESFSLTCLEALFYGRPLIATRCGGPEEIIDDAKTGILVALRDVEEMAKAIDFLLSNQNVSQQMASRAYAAVREKFGGKNTRERLQSLYLEAFKMS